MHLPGQLAAVDPIVASFCGGAVGVLTTLLLVEVNNSDMQARNRCIYCGVSSPLVAHVGGRPCHSYSYSCRPKQHSVKGRVPWYRAPAM